MNYKEAIDKLMAICDNATPAPWYEFHTDDDMCMNSYGVSTVGPVDFPEDEHERIVALTLYQSKRVVCHKDHKWDFDARFIAVAREALPEALILLKDAAKLVEIYPDEAAQEWLRKLGRLKDLL